MLTGYFELASGLQRDFVDISIPFVYDPHVTKVWCIWNSKASAKLSRGSYAREHTHNELPPTTCILLCMIVCPYIKYLYMYVCILVCINRTRYTHTHTHTHMNQHHQRYTCMWLLKPRQNTARTINLDRPTQTP